MKRQALLLFKNAFKQALRNKIQLVGLIVLVLLSSTIFSLMQTSLTRIDHEYQTLVKTSNLHDFVIDLADTATTDKSQPSDNIEPADPVINGIAADLTNGFIWDRVEGRTIQLDNDNNPRILKILTYNKDARIDKLVVNEDSGYLIGANPAEKTPPFKQTVINKQFAQKNGLKLGDTIRVQGDELGTSLKVNYDLNDPLYSTYQWLKIVGFGTSADFTTPIIDQTKPIPDKMREGILYVDPLQFGLSKTPSADQHNFIWSYDKANEKITIVANNDREIYFVGKSNMANHKNDLHAISLVLKHNYVNTTDATAALVYQLGDNNYRFSNRTSILIATISGFKTLLIALLLIVLVITGITVVLITYKNIDNARPQIGVLKSLGYSNRKILITSLAYPMIAALVGTILVFLPASGLQLVIIHAFANYFNLDFGKFIFDGIGFIYCLILTFGFLSIISWIISALTVMGKPIDLIKNESVTVHSAFNRLIKRRSVKFSFLNRFRLSLFTSSIGKMATVSLTMFLGTTLMTTAIIGPKIMADNKTVSYTGMNYLSTTEYDVPTYNSPFTMYKTYNPTLKDPWPYKTIYGYDSSGNRDGTTYVRPNRDDPGIYVQELLDNSINSEAYAPMSLEKVPKDALNTDLGPNNLSFLYGKMLTKSFLQGLDQSKVDDPDYAAPIAALAWPQGGVIYDVTNLYPNIPKTKPRPAFYSETSFNTLKQFYRDYRSTVGMNLNPNAAQGQDPNAIDHTKLTEVLKNMDCKDVKPADFTKAIADFTFDKSDHQYPWHLPNETDLLNKTYDELDQASRDAWINKIAIWFGTLFYNRVGQSVLQGTYSRSPYFIRQNIANAYQNPDSQFNISFNTIPYDNKTDELGTYFTGTPDISFNGKNYPMKVYGLQSYQQLDRVSYMQLYNSDGIALNPLLEQATDNDSTTNIVINQTIAKQLNLNVNSEFQMCTNGNIMEFKNKNDDYQAFDPKTIDASNIKSVDPQPDDENNVTLQLKNLNFPNTITDLETGGAYNNIGINAPPILQDVASGKVVSTHDTIQTNYKVVGIYNGYGEPSAYISKTKADHLLHYDRTAAALFEIFREEWVNKKTIAGVDFAQLDRDNITDYDTFMNKAKPDLIKVFNNENPVFNFKLSTVNTLPDVTTSFSTSQIYGDYSALGLNGGTDIISQSQQNYQGYGAGSAINVSPLYVHQQLLNQITALVDAVLSAFIAFALIISFFIILLTSNLVIYENRKTIATMKTLGYSDIEITNIVIGMYLPVIAAMFIFGFPIGWLFVKTIINYLAHHTVWVLPLFFAWWLPLVVGVIVFGIYALTFVIDWYAMKRINPIKTLIEMD